VVDEKALFNALSLFAAALDSSANLDEPRFTNTASNRCANCCCATAA